MRERRDVQAWLWLGSSNCTCVLVRGKNLSDANCPALSDKVSHHVEIRHPSIREFLLLSCPYLSLDYSLPLYSCSCSAMQ
jgi:hypothetical protein